MTTLDRALIQTRALDMHRQGRAKIRDQFLNGQAQGPETADALAILMDETLQFIWHEIGSQLAVDLADHLALLAVGGYGRGQLAPHSDVDLLFLRISRQTALQDQAVEAMLYILWDMGLKVGQAVRTPGECLKLGAEDFTILTSLIEMRLIRGSRQGFIALRRAVDRRLLHPHRRAFVVAKMAEREARHKRQGGSRFILEPNIKENKGGLRDLHALSWIARAVFGDGQVETLMSHGVFSLAQARAFQAAEAFLLSVRIHLHYLTNRAEERLSFDTQIDIAQAMGFEAADQEAPKTGVEAFMQAYFRAAQEVGTLTGIMIATMEEEFGGTQGGLRRAWRTRHSDCEGFWLIGGRLALRGAQQLAQTPLDFLRYFLVAHERGLAHAPSSLRLMTQNLRLIDADMQASDQANALFLQLLTHESNPIVALKTMNQTGVLAAFLPQWQSIVGLMQFNRYHHYTVDEHTLNAIDQLHQLRGGDLGDGTAPVHAAFADMDDPLVLFVATLYHDIAKGRPGRHEVEGAKLAPAICARLGLSHEQTDQVTWLIREHLSLSATAFERDLDDPDTIASIADWTESIEDLRMLYVLTAADVRAVGPDTWSAWKGALLQRAYSDTDKLLREGAPGWGAATEHREKTARALIERGADQPLIDAYINAAPDGYWLAYEMAERLRHFDLYAQQNHLDLQILKTRKALSLTLCVQDRPGLMAHLAGAVALAGWSVEATKAHTFRNGTALDTLFLRKIGKSAAPSEKDLKPLKTLILQALEGQLTLKDLGARLPRSRSKRESAMDRPSAVKIYTPQLPTSPTVIEVRGPDRPALLFDLTTTLLQLNLQLQSVRVATYGERFVNVFYLTDLMGYRLEGADRLARIQSALIRAAEGQASL